MAAEVAELSDFGDDRFVEGLDRYLASVRREAGLSALGEAIVHADLQGLLVNRLRFENDLKRHPEILDEEISGVLVITGLPRTGTTKLHQLIGRDPAVNSLPFWRILNMAPLPGSAAKQPDPRIAIAESVVAAQAVMAPDILSAHASQAMEPEEDIFVMRMTFESQANAMFDHVPSYYAWLERQPTGYSYRYLKRLLQYAQWQDGSRRACPWILKSPLHLSQMDVLLETFGDVSFVQCHRDPAITLPSTMRLYEVMWSGRGGSTDPQAISRMMLSRWQREIDCGLSLRERLGHRLRILDVPYRFIAEDGTRAITAVYDFWQRPLTQETLDAMADWNLRNPQHRFGPHAYSLDRYGLSEADVAAAFRPYKDWFRDLLR